MVLGGLGLLFWLGSGAFYHLPLIALAPLVLLMVWQTRQLRKDRPRTGRDRVSEAAAGGNPEACYQLGLAHRRGTSQRPKDDLTAALWFRRAAEAGHAGAMQALAEAYLGGHGVLRDPREAARWTEAARRESTS
ncbi:MAG: sel1 repeat family protein [Acidobacteria bacterium]|nr:sel1 repeat family protein [Acidobacteriota bacterium]MBI3486695.1 sel1 repeat family protein [Acidobacteriota bacterium]